MSTTAGAGALLALALCGAAAVRRRNRAGRPSATDA
ncbi:MYXO-CTERM sorting domain-containing protein [Streptomyces sp. rh195]